MLLQSVLSFFFGRDIFISYCYADSAYAEALGVALGREKFSVFLGGWAASPGEKLSREVTNAARQSRLLVVIATPRSRHSGPVQEEIGYFAAAHKPVVPIDVGLGIRDAKKEWPALSGTDVVHEPRVDGPPSAHVIERIVNAATFARQTTRLRRFLASVLFATLALTGSAGGFALWSRGVAKAAEERARSADSRATSAVHRAEDAGRKAAEAGKRESEANLRAGEASVRASEAQSAADHAEERRGVAAAAAERESSIASSIRMVNEADALLRMQPARIGSAALQAVQAVRFLQQRGTRALAADTLIRTTLDLLPIIEERTPFNITSDRTTRTTRDGRWVTQRTASGIEVIDTTTGKAVPYIVPAEIDRQDEIFALSEDGRTLAAAFVARGSRWRHLGESVILLWRVGDSSHAAVFNAYFVQGLTLSRDGQLLAFAGFDHLSVVRVTDGAIEAEQPYRSRDALRRDLAFNANHEALVVAGEPAIVWPWRDHGVPIASPRAGNAYVFAHPTDPEIVVTHGNTLDVWRWSDWKKPQAQPIWSTAAVEPNPGMAAFSEDGKFLGLHMRGLQAQIVEWRMSETPPRTISLREGAVHIASVLPWALVVAFSDGSVELLSVSAAANARAVHDGVILTAVPRWDGTIRSVSTAGAMTWRPEHSRRYFGQATEASAISPDGTTVAVANGMTIEVYGEPHVRLRVERPASAVAIGYDGAVIAGTREGDVFRFAAARDIADPQVPERSMKASMPIERLAVNRAGDVVFASAESVWIARAGAEPQLIADLDSNISALTFSDRGDVIAAGCDDGRAVVLPLHGLRARTTFRSKGRVQALAFSPDGAYIAIGRQRESAVISPVADPNVRFVLPGDPATALAFHPSDGTIAAGGQAAIVRVWSDWRNERPLEVARFSGGWHLVLARFSDDGRYLITVPRNGSGEKRLWRSEDLVTVACRRLYPLRGTGEYGAFDVICAGQSLTPQVSPPTPTTTGSAAR